MEYCDVDTDYDGNADDLNGGNSSDTDTNNSDNIVMITALIMMKMIYGMLWMMEMRAMIIKIKK